MTSLLTALGSFQHPHLVCGSNPKQNRRSYMSRQNHNKPRSKNPSTPSQPISYASAASGKPAAAAAVPVTAAAATPPPKVAARLDISTPNSTLVDDALYGERADGLTRTIDSALKTGLNGLNADKDVKTPPPPPKVVASGHLLMNARELPSVITDEDTDNPVVHTSQYAGRGAKVPPPSGVVGDGRPMVIAKRQSKNKSRLKQNQKFSEEDEKAAAKFDRDPNDPEYREELLKRQQKLDEEFTTRLEEAAKENAMRRKEMNLKQIEAAGAVVDDALAKLERLGAATNGVSDKPPVAAPPPTKAAETKTAVATAVTAATAAAAAAAPEVKTRPNMPSLDKVPPAVYASAYHAAQPGSQIKPTPIATNATITAATTTPATATTTTDADAKKAPTSREPEKYLGERVVKDALNRQFAAGRKQKPVTEEEDKFMRRLQALCDKSFEKVDPIMRDDKHKGLVSWTLPLNANTITSREILLAQAQSVNNTAANIRHDKPDDEVVQKVVDWVTSEIAMLLLKSTLDTEITSIGVCFGLMPMGNEAFFQVQMQTLGYKTGIGSKIYPKPDLSTLIQTVPALKAIVPSTTTTTTAATSNAAAAGSSPVKA